LIVRAVGGRTGFIDELDFAIAIRGGEAGVKISGGLHFGITKIGVVENNVFAATIFTSRQQPVLRFVTRPATTRSLAVFLEVPPKKQNDTDF